MADTCVCFHLSVLVSSVFAFLLIINRKAEYVAMCDMILLSTIKLSDNSTNLFVQSASELVANDVPVCLLELAEVIE